MGKELENVLKQLKQLIEETSKVWENGKRLQVNIKKAVQQGNFEDLSILLDLYLHNREEAIIMMELGRKYGFYKNAKSQERLDFLKEEVEFYQEFKENYQPLKIISSKAN